MSRGCQDGVKRMSREWQMDVNRESKYVKRVPRGSREGVKDSEFVKSLGFLSRLKRFNVLRGFQKYVKSCERVSRVVKRMSRGCKEGVKSCEEGHSVKSCGEGVKSCEEGVKSCQGCMRVTVSRRCQRVVKRVLPIFPLQVSEKCWLTVLADSAG